MHGIGLQKGMFPQKSASEKIICGQNGRCSLQYPPLKNLLSRDLHIRLQRFFGPFIIEVPGIPEINNKFRPCKTGEQVCKDN